MKTNRPFNDKQEITWYYDGSVSAYAIFVSKSSRPLLKELHLRYKLSIDPIWCVCNDSHEMYLDRSLDLSDVVHVFILISSADRMCATVISRQSCRVALFIYLL